MTRVLLIGYVPETVDFSDPALPPGLTAEAIHAGIASGVRQLIDRGWEPGTCLVNPDHTAIPAIVRELMATRYDCVVIGAGIRVPPRGLALFEAILNTVHRVAPDAAIAFNTRPDDTADAAARALALGGRAE